MTAKTLDKSNSDALLRRWLHCIVAPEPSSLSRLHNSFVPSDWAGIVSLAQAHGVLPLLHELPEVERFCLDKSVDCQTIRSALTRTALLDRLHRDLLRALDEQLHVLNFPVLVIKGAALSLTHYRTPGLRPRVDTDLFIEAKNRGRWDGLMQEMGFIAVPANFSSLVLPERTYQKQLAGAYLQLDVHWSLSSRPLLGEKLNFASMYDAGIAFEQAKSLRMPMPVDALLVAVVHRIGHHRDLERYIWLYDIYLLWSAMDEQTKEDALQVAQNLGLAAILLEALKTTAELFPLPLPVTGPRDKEVSAQLLDGQNPIWFDFRYASWRERWLLLKERVWAEPSYLRHRFKSSMAPMWYLQLRRWFS